MCMAISFAGVDTYNDESPSVKSPDPLVTRSNVNYFSSCITTATRTMTTKLGKVVAYYKKLQSIKSHTPLSPCSHEVM